MASRLIAALLALTSTIDPKVRLIHQLPQNGSNQWPSVAFNDYSYQPNKAQGATETRTRAMADIFGQASVLLGKSDPEGTMSVRTFYKNAKGENVPRLHIVERPTATASAQVMDVNTELAAATTEAIALEIDIAAIPVSIMSNSAVALSFLRAAIAKANTELAAQAVTVAVEDEAPPV